MANVEAFNSGWDLGTRDPKKTKEKDKKESSSSNSKNGNSDKQKQPSFADMKSFHKGGKVRRTGPAKLKKGEIVLTASQAKTYGVKPKSHKKTVSRKQFARKA